MRVKGIPNTYGKKKTHFQAEFIYIFFLSIQCFSQVTHNTNKAKMNSFFKNPRKRQI